MRNSVCALVAMVALTGVFGGAARSDFNPKRWERYSPIEAPAGVKAKYAQVTLDRGVYLRADPNDADLRVVANGAREIPFNLLIDSDETSEVQRTSRIQDSMTVPKKYSSFVIDLGKPGILSSRVKIRTTSSNFTRKVSIYASGDGVKWAVLRDDGYIFNFSRDYFAESVVVDYPRSSQRYIRVRIWNLREKPIESISAEVFLLNRKPAVRYLAYAGLGDVYQNARDKSTDVVLDIGGVGPPVDRVEIESPNVNYHRQVEIAGSENLRVWSSLHWGEIYKFATDKVRGGKSNVDVGIQGYRYIRLRIRNFDDPPIRISKVRVYCYRRRVFFPYKPGENYRLYYGNPEAESPTYDIQTVFQYLSTEKAPRLKLGPGVGNAAYIQPFGTKYWLEKNPWALWVTLLVAAVLLGYLIVRSIVATRAAMVMEETAPPDAPAKEPD
ncbi:MAG: DUF3999 family protein [Armatimonadota bacterium]|nr:DUF3999 family protein [Armatimonadota bacterium]